MDVINNPKLKIAILYICTGNYVDFFENFLNSMKSHLFPEAHIEYFIFTDSVLIAETERVHIIYQKQIGWPFDTLLRFQMFYDIKDSLQHFDYILFMNANLLANKTISTDILDFDKDYLAVVHPLYHNIPKEKMTYERKQESTAFMDPNWGQYYFMGGLNGGKAKPFLAMCETLASNIEDDLENKIVAIWHDESHINHFFWKNKENLTILDNYPVLYEQSINKKNNPLFKLIDKTYKGGYQYFRKYL